MKTGRFEWTLTALSSLLLYTSSATATEINVKNNGLFMVGQGGTCKIVSGGSIVVESGGKLYLDGIYGDSNKLAKLASISGTYSFTYQTGSGCVMKGCDISNLGTSGIVIQDQAWIYIMQWVTFNTAGSGPALDLSACLANNAINRKFAFSCVGIDFNGTGSSNIKCGQNTPPLNILGGTGARWGATYEDDPFNRCQWPTYTVQRTSSPPATAYYNTMTEAVQSLIGTGTASLPQYTTGTFRFSGPPTDEMGYIDYVLPGAIGITIESATFFFLGSLTNNPVFGTPYRLADDTDAGDVRRVTLRGCRILKGDINEVTLENCTIFDPTSGSSSVTKCSASNTIFEGSPTLETTNPAYTNQTNWTNAVAGFFVDPNSGDLHLKGPKNNADADDTDQLIDQGTNLGFSVTDQDGQAFGSNDFSSINGTNAWETGADEVQLYVSPGTTAIVPFVAQSGPLGETGVIRYSKRPVEGSMIMSAYYLSKTKAAGESNNKFYIISNQQASVPGHGTLLRGQVITYITLPGAPIDFIAKPVDYSTTEFLVFIWVAIDTDNNGKPDGIICFYDSGGAKRDINGKYSWETGYVGSSQFTYGTDNYATYDTSVPCYIEPNWMTSYASDLNGNQPGGKRAGFCKASKRVSSEPSINAHNGVADVSEDWYCTNVLCPVLCLEDSAVTAGQDADGTDNVLKMTSQWQISGGGLSSVNIGKMVIDKNPGEDEHAVTSSHDRACSGARCFFACGNGIMFKLNFDLVDGYRAYDANSPTALGEMIWSSASRVNYWASSAITGVASSGDTSVTVSSGTNFKSKGTLYFRDSDGHQEACTYTSKSGNTFSGIDLIVPNGKDETWKTGTYVPGTDTLLTVDSTTGFHTVNPSYACVINGSTVDYFSYTGVTATTFTGIPTTGAYTIDSNYDNNTIVASFIAKTEEVVSAADNTDGNIRVDSHAALNGVTGTGWVVDGNQWTKFSFTSVSSSPVQLEGVSGIDANASIASGAIVCFSMTYADSLSTGTTSSAQIISSDKVIEVGSTAGFPERGKAFIRTGTVDPNDPLEWKEFKYTSIDTSPSIRFKGVDWIDNPTFPVSTGRPISRVIFDSGTVSSLPYDGVVVSTTKPIFEPRAQPIITVGNHHKAVMSCSPGWSGTVGYNDDTDRRCLVKVECEGSVACPESSYWGWNTTTVKNEWGFTASSANPNANFIVCPSNDTRIAVVNANANSNIGVWQINDSDADSTYELNLANEAKYTGSSKNCTGRAKYHENYILAPFGNEIHKLRASNGDSIWTYNGHGDISTAIELSANYAVWGTQAGYCYVYRVSGSQDNPGGPTEGLLFQYNAGRRVSIVRIGVFNGTLQASFYLADGDTLFFNL